MKYLIYLLVMAGIICFAGLYGGFWGLITAGFIAYEIGAFK